MVIFSFFDRFGQRPGTVIRLAGLVALVVWQAATTRGLGVHGRELTITLMMAGASVGWIRWAWAFTGPGGPTRPEPGWDVYLMGLCGGLMIGASDTGPAAFFVFVAAFSAGARVGMPVALVSTAVSVVAVCASWVIYDQHGIGELAYSLGILATAFGGTQRHDTVQRHEQAELLLAQTQRSHEEQLRAARLEESGRIAREIHDVLAHSLAGLTIQLEATAALVEAGADRDTVLPRLRHAHELARDGLRETRLAVGALRDDAATVVPAAARIETLVSDFRATGREITLGVQGDRGALSGPSADAAMRIIQEALTNVTKHAPGARVDVRVDAGPPLILSVDSYDGAPVTTPPSSLSASGGGYGIAGMRERAEELGGSVSAGPTAQGWRVSAELPGQAPAEATP